MGTWITFDGYRCIGESTYKSSGADITLFLSGCGSIGTGIATDSEFCSSRAIKASRTRFSFNAISRSWCGASTIAHKTGRFKEQIFKKIFGIFIRDNQENTEDSMAIIIPRGAIRCTSICFSRRVTIFPGRT